MTESGLSNQINPIAVLPEPTEATATADPDGTVSVSWTTNDDSTDGGFDLERSSSGGASWATVATSIDPSSTSYTDTTAALGEDYLYRVIRETDHTSATSNEASASTFLPVTIHGERVSEITIDGERIRSLTYNGQTIF